MGIPKLPELTDVSLVQSSTAQKVGLSLVKALSGKKFNGEGTAETAAPSPAAGSAGFVTFCRIAAAFAPLLSGRLESLHGTAGTAASSGQTDP